MSAGGARVAPCRTCQLRPAHGVVRGREAQHQRAQALKLRGAVRRRQARSLEVPGSESENTRTHAEKVRTSVASATARCGHPARSCGGRARCASHARRETTPHLGSQALRQRRRWRVRRGCRCCSDRRRPAAAAAAGVTQQRLRLRRDAFQRQARCPGRRAAADGGAARGWQRRRHRLHVRITRLSLAAAVCAARRAAGAAAHHGRRALSRSHAACPPHGAGNTLWKRPAGERGGKGEDDTLIVRGADRTGPADVPAPLTTETETRLRVRWAGRTRCCVVWRRKGGALSARARLHASAGAQTRSPFRACTRRALSAPPKRGGTPRWSPWTTPQAREAASSAPRSRRCALKPRAATAAAAAQPLYLSAGTTVSLPHT
jgi:hypothetical protein